MNTTSVQQTCSKRRYVTLVTNP